ncbi:MAG: DUF1638 domain-containing protein [Deltaproteobacteria bacterium]|jgi:hypothetical protein|nr:DUF1638 domain-containing protein [Deltaproteobacteria bacterium]
MQRTLIACNIFEEELKAVLENQTDFEVKTIFLQAGLHNDMDLMTKELNEAFQKVTEGDPAVRLLLGYGCHPDLIGSSEITKFPVLSTKNCLGALLGEAKIMELEQNKTMVITPAWIRKVWFADNGMRHILGWDDTDFRLNFGRYDRILVLDFGLSPLTDEEILDAFSVVEVPIEVESFPLDHFEKFLLDFLA